MAVGGFIDTTPQKRATKHAAVALMSRAERPSRRAAACSSTSRERREPADHRPGDPPSSPTHRTPPGAKRPAARRYVLASSARPHAPPTDCPADETNTTFPVRRVTGQALHSGIASTLVTHAGSLVACRVALTQRRSCYSARRRCPTRLPSSLTASSQRWARPRRCVCRPPLSDDDTVGGGVSCRKSASS
jgi:hypothetical protein